MLELITLGMAFLILHLIVDGYRVQMIPLYTLFAICGFSFGIYGIRVQNRSCGSEEFLKRKEGILKNGGTEGVIAGSDHMSFSDGMLYSLLLGKRDLSLLHEINQVLLQFFDQNVKKLSR